ncbi:hypothetical protein QUF90_19455 [Desulfococcaceae bacterium HSG9]|nr:hypothetical protein [Desulfococcaceae bacterium HSG9]
MKKLINDILKFNGIFIIGNILLLVGTIVLEKNIISFNIPSDKTVLVIGTSQVASAINDDILTNTFNFSDNGSGYFYTYLKIRKILEHNPQIDTVVIGYSYLDIKKYRDEWVGKATMLKFKMPQHLFLFDFSDFYFLYISNPYEVLINIHRTTLQGIKHIIKYLLSSHSLDSWGGFDDSMEADKLQESKNRHIACKKIEKVEYSKYQEEYLLKIYSLVMAKNVNLILLNVPIHPMLKEEQKEYTKYYYLLAQQKLSKATIINHANMDIPEYGFFDLVHLNYEGAKLYSEYLKEHNFLSESHPSDYNSD